MRKYIPIAIIILIYNCLSLQAQQYSLTDLGVIGDGPVFIDINENEQAAGWYYILNTGFSAFYWENGNLTQITPSIDPQTFLTAAVSINDSGYVLMCEEIDMSEFFDIDSLFYYIWKDGITNQVLGMPDEFSAYNEEGLEGPSGRINNENRVVALDFADVGNGTNADQRVYLWNGTSWTQLGVSNPPLPFNVDIRPPFINNDNLIVAHLAGIVTPTPSIKWEDNSPSYLPFDGRVNAVNDSSNMTGATANGGFIYKNGVFTNIFSNGIPGVDINNKDEVVGFNLLYTDGQTHSIESLLNATGNGYSNFRLTAINDNSVIVGSAQFNGQWKAVLLKPQKYPVFIVPGIAGTYSSSTLADIGWILARGVNPLDLQIDPLGKVYDDIIKTFQNVGYKKDSTLFAVNYDWRLTPGPIDNNIDGNIDGLTGLSITDNQFDYGIDYFGWYLKKASEYWRQTYGEDLDSIDVIAHSTGGLVTRTYIQSGAYGDVYDIANNYRLPKIRNFIMIGVPNRGASKAWNPLYDNWTADRVYKFVLSKILNRAYQKVLEGYTITGPDYDIDSTTISDSLGNPSKIKFISQYVPTIRGLLATYDFIDFGNGYVNVNSDPNQRNIFLLDLNDGLDLNSSADANKFLDSTKVFVIHGTGETTKDLVEQRSNFGLLALQSFTDWIPSNAYPGTIWYKDLDVPQNGDGTVPTISSAGQFQNDNRAILLPFSTGDHTGLVSKTEVQSNILNILNVTYESSNISTGSSPSLGNVWNVIGDPVDLLLIDGNGSRLGHTSTTGTLTEIPNSIWFGSNDGMGYVFGSLIEPVNLQLTGLGEEYYVMVSVEDSGKYGGVVLEGFLALGEVINYQIILDPLSVEPASYLTPDNYSLTQNYPNPFNPVTSIQYSIPNRSKVLLKVYDVVGNEVATLVNEEMERGVYTVTFDASKLASGIYLFRIQAGSFLASRKMVLIK